MYKRILFASFIFFAACGPQTQAVIPPTPTPEMIIAASAEVTAATASPEVTVSTTASPVSTGIAEPCAYVEATQNLPDVSAQIDKAVKQLQSSAGGRAQTYGENCLDAGNGQSSFHAMETDFYFKINVKNLDDDNELGMWIIKVMKIVEAVPSNALPGPQTGFVDFTFKGSNNQRILHLPISHYKSLIQDVNPSGVIPTLFPTP